MEAKYDCLPMLERQGSYNDKSIDFILRIVEQTFLDGESNLINTLLIKKVPIT
jgi:hypothetical protein